MRHVHPYLVGAAGFEAAANEACDGRITKGFNDLVVGNCLSGGGCVRDRHLLAIGVGTSQAGGDHAGTTVRHSPDESEVFTLHPAIAAMAGKLLGQALMREIVLGDDEKSAGLLVQPMDDAGAFDAADTGETVAAMGEQSIDQCAGFIAGTGMDDEACWLVDDQKILVLKHNLKGDWFRLRFGWCCLWQVELNWLPGCDLLIGIRDDGSGNRHLTVGDQLLQARAAQGCKVVFQNVIEPACNSGGHLMQAGSNFDVQVMFRCCQFAIPQDCVIGVTGSLRLSVRTAASHVAKAGSIPAGSARVRFCASMISKCLSEWLYTWSIEPELSDLLKCFAQLLIRFRLQCAEAFGEGDHSFCRALGAQSIFA